MKSYSDLLTILSESHGTSGHEDRVREVVLREMKKYVDDVRVTPLGSVIGCQWATSPKGRHARRELNHTPRVLLEAHMDEIGLMVTQIQDGFIRFTEVGSFDPRVLPSQNVLVHGRKTVPGVIGSRPPHVLSESERGKTIPMEEMFIDVGLTDARARELVNVGDTITLDRKVTALRNGNVSGKAFDDRAGVVVVLETLRRLENTHHSWDVYGVINVNEEDSPLYLGALTSTFEIRPQIAIALDVTHADQPGVPDMNIPHIGDGPNIAFGANVHPFIHQRLVQAAEREKIPHSVCVYPESTQTNAWMMQVVAEGIPTGLVEVPLRYMHTSVELLNLADIERTAGVLTSFVETLDSTDRQALEGEAFGPLAKPRRARRLKVKRKVKRSRKRR